MNKSNAVCNIKPSDVLRRAAELIKDGEWTGCCAAINAGDYKLDAPQSTRKRAYEFFASLYKPKSKGSGDWWFHKSGINDEFKTPTIEEQEHRIMALLLTADMAESVGE